MNILEQKPQGGAGLHASLRGRDAENCALARSSTRATVSLSSTKRQSSNDNPETRYAHDFPQDMQSIEVRQIVKAANNTGDPFPEVKDPSKSPSAADDGLLTVKVSVACCTPALPDK